MSTQQNFTRTIIPNEIKNMQANLDLTLDPNPIIIN